MGIEVICAVLSAIIVSTLINMLIQSLKENIIKNTEYDEYISRKPDTNKILREGPEAYEFRERDLIRDFRLNLKEMKKAVCSKQYMLILLLNTLIIMRIITSTSDPLKIVTATLVMEALLLLSLVDIKYGLIPDSIHVVILVAALLGILSDGPFQFRARLIGMAVGGIFFWILYLLGGMGGGDVKLMAVAGFWLGYPMIIIAMFVGVFVAAIVGLVLILIGKKSRKDTMVFGPYLAGGIIVVTLFCEEIINFIV